jgi:hypothetical protein
MKDRASLTRLAGTSKILADFQQYPLSEKLMPHIDRSHITTIEKLPINYCIQSTYPQFM